jgi:hypothetical protein
MRHLFLMDDSKLSLSRNSKEKNNMFKDPETAKERKAAIRRLRVHAPALNGEAKSQLDAIGVAVTSLLDAVRTATLVPNRHLLESKRFLSQELLKILKGRKIDPRVRQRERLEAKIKEAQDKLLEMEAAS